MQYPIEVGELSIGDNITLWHANGHGQGGTITAIFPGVIHLVSGTSEAHSKQRLADWSHVMIERPMPAYECIDFNEDCFGDVEHCCTPGGGSMPRCEHHNDKRWERYESDESSERYANCSSAPSWFDPGACGEHWDTDY